MIEFESEGLGLLVCAGVEIGASCELSEVGGEGGVCVSEAVEETDFVGGVAIVGEDGVVSIGECSDTCDCGLEIGSDGRRRDCSAIASAFRSFS